MEKNEKMLEIREGKEREAAYAELKGELLKAQIIAKELINDINNSSCTFEEKQCMDGKGRIVCDYLEKVMKQELR